MNKAFILKLKIDHVIELFFFFYKIVRIIENFYICLLLRFHYFLHACYLRFREAAYIFLLTNDRNALSLLLPYVFFNI